MYRSLVITIALVLSASSLSAQSFRDRDFPSDRSKKVERNYEKVKWVGYIEADGSHTSKHYHDLDFVRQSDGESFDVIKSPALEKIHCDTEKRLLVEIEAERTPKVLFWGNNLIVKKFTVLEELEPVPHKKHVAHSMSTRRDRL